MGGFSLVLGVILTVLSVLPGRAAGDPLDAALAEQIYGLAERWVASGWIPAETVALDVEDFAAVRVTLRQRGMALGYATSAVGGEGPARSMMWHVGHAVNTALNKVRTFRGLSTVAMGAEPPVTEPKLADDLVLDMQLATTPTLIDLQSLDQLPKHAVMGRDGLAMRGGDEQWAWSFPGSAIANRTSPAGQLKQLLKQLGFPMHVMEMIGTLNGPPLHRFDVIHLVRQEPGTAVLELTRGNVVLPTTPLDDAGLLSLGESMVAHLVDRRMPNGRFIGTYLPSSGLTLQSVASSEEAALASYALARWGKVAVDDAEGRQALLDMARRSAAIVVDQLSDGRGEGGARRQVRLGASAMALIAMLEMPGASSRKNDRDRLHAKVWAMQGGDGWFREAMSPDSARASVPKQALGTWAMVRMYEQTRDATHLRQAQAALKALWQGIEDDRLVGALPWLAMAEFDLARLGHPTPGLLTLEQLCQSLWEKQVRPINLTEDPTYIADTVGGFAVGSDLFGEPNWRSASIVMTMAGAMRVRNFVAEEDRVGWLINTGLGARYLSQLTVGPTSTWYMPRAKASLGGVRVSLTDNQQPLFATAMALLAVVELHESMARFEQ